MKHEFVSMAMETCCWDLNCGSRFKLQEGGREGGREVLLPSFLPSFLTTTTTTPTDF